MREFEEYNVAQHNFKLYKYGPQNEYVSDECVLRCGTCDRLFTGRESTRKRHERKGTKPYCPECRGKRAACGARRKLRKEALL